MDMDRVKILPTVQSHEPDCREGKKQCILKQIAASTAPSSLKGDTGDMNAVD